MHAPLGKHRGEKNTDAPCGAQNRWEKNVQQLLHNDKWYDGGHIGEGSRLDDLGASLGFRLPNTSGF